MQISKKLLIGKYQTQILIVQTRMEYLHTDILKDHLQNHLFLTRILLFWFYTRFKTSGQLSTTSVTG